MWNDTYFCIKAEQKSTLLNVSWQGNEKDDFWNMWHVISHSSLLTMQLFNHLLINLAILVRPNIYIVSVNIIMFAEDVVTEPLSFFPHSTPTPL